MLPVNEGDKVAICGDAVLVIIDCTVCEPVDVDSMLSIALSVCDDACVDVPVGACKKLDDDVRVRVGCRVPMPVGLGEVVGLGKVIGVSVDTLDVAVWLVLGVGDPVRVEVLVTILLGVTLDERLPLCV